MLGAIIVGAMDTASVVWFRVRFNMLLLHLCQSRNSGIGVSYDESYGPDHPATLRNTLPGGENSAIHNQRHV